MWRLERDIALTNNLQTLQVDSNVGESYGGITEHGDLVVAKCPVSKPESAASDSASHSVEAAPEQSPARAEKGNPMQHYDGAWTVVCAHCKANSSFSGVDSRWQVVGHMINKQNKAPGEEQTTTCTAQLAPSC